MQLRHAGCWKFIIIILIIMIIIVVVRFVMRVQLLLVRELIAYIVEFLEMIDSRLAVVVDVGCADVAARESTVHLVIAEVF